MNLETAADNLLAVRQILDDAAIPFWLAFGTFLGAYREGRIIPWDDDIDLAIYSEDLAALVKCNDAFIKAGFGLRVGQITDDPCSVALYRDDERIGFACFKLAFWWVTYKRVWKSIRYDVAAFETYNEIQFLGQRFRILSEPERWLRYTYGEDWKTPIRRKGVGVGFPYGEEFES